MSYKNNENIVDLIAGSVGIPFGYNLIHLRVQVTCYVVIVNGTFLENKIKI